MDRKGAFTAYSTVRIWDFSGRAGGSWIIWVPKGSDINVYLYSTDGTTIPGLSYKYYTAASAAFDIDVGFRCQLSSRNLLTQPISHFFLIFISVMLQFKRICDKIQLQPWPFRLTPQTRPPDAQFQIPQSPRRTNPTTKAKGYIVSPYIALSRIAQPIHDQDLWTDPLHLSSETQVRRIYLTSDKACDFVFASVGLLSGFLGICRSSLRVSLFSLLDRLGIRHAGGEGRNWERVK